MSESSAASNYLTNDDFEFYITENENENHQKYLKILFINFK